jgi:hypothetical protein
MAGIFRKIFGFTHKKENEKKPQDTVPQKTGGFSVKVAVPADPTLYAPVVTQCNGNGGVQGLTWYAERLRADDDGDVAQEFLKEVVPRAQGPDRNAQPTFEAVSHTRPVKLKGPVCTQNGNVHQTVELSGKYLWT